MLTIRLQRTGRENLATYRIVVAEKARPVKGKFLEIVGHYLPAQKDPVFNVDDKRVEHWVGKGAVPSNTLARLLKKKGMKGMEKFIVSYAKQRSKSAPAEEPAAPPAPAAAAPVAEAPAAPVEEKAPETPETQEKTADDSAPKQE